MDSNVATLSVAQWTALMLSDDEFELPAVDFSGLSDAPKGKSGVELLKASCALLDAVGKVIDEHIDPEDEGERPIPYIKFALEGTAKAIRWSAEWWNDLAVDAASLEINMHGDVFYWGTWEAHQVTVGFPVGGYPQFVAIFRQSRECDEKGPWDTFENDLYIVPKPA